MAFVQEHNKKQLGLFRVGAVALTLGVVATFLGQVWWGNSPLSRAAMLVTCAGALLVLLSVRGRDGDYVLETSLDRLPGGYEVIPTPGRLEANGQPILVDCLLIGPNGVFAIDTIQLTGHVQVSSAYWTTGRRSKRRQLPSPVARLQVSVAMLKNWLPSTDIPIHAAVCILDTHTVVDGSDDIPVIRLDDLVEFILNQPGTWPDDVNVRKVIKRLSA